MSSGLRAAFRQHHCTEVGFFANLEIKRRHLKQLREVVAGKRTNLPYHFGHRYPGRAGQKVAVTAHLERETRQKFDLIVRWFQADSDPPEDYGDWEAARHVFEGIVEQRESQCRVEFEYNRKKFESALLPVKLPEQSIAFDEITALTSVKRAAKGKISYQLTVSLTQDVIRHVVIFFQTISLEESLPVTLVEIGSRISQLGLRTRRDRT